MSGNTFGKLFTITTAGESHGPAYVGIIDGCPPGLPLTEADIQLELDRRRPGSSRYTTQRREPDQLRILSGVFEGKTTGTPIGMLVENVDVRSRDYAAIAQAYRPGHADFTYHKKYGVYDVRGGGRASARETLMRVAAGAVAKKYLRDVSGVTIRGCLSMMGDRVADAMDWDVVEHNPFFFPDAAQVPLLEDDIHQLRRDGDSVGGVVTVVASGVPVGLGEPVFDRLDADLAHAMMSINAAKGVELGAGFAAAVQRGTEHRDPITPQGFTQNQSGGLLGGISTGQDVVVRVAFKPTSSLTTPGDTIDWHGEATTVVTKGRHDPCVAIRAVPIVEAMMALVLMDHLLRDRAQNALVERT